MINVLKCINFDRLGKLIWKERGVNRIKKNTFVAENSAREENGHENRKLLHAEIQRGRDARVVEEARLESVYTPKAYRGFESPSLRMVL